MAILIKSHKSYRSVIAICDLDLIGKKFEEGIRQLDIREHFFKGEEVADEEAINIMREQCLEDSTFNIVGENAINLALKAEIITEEVIGRVQNIPFALKLI